MRSIESPRRMPGGLPHLTIAFASLLLVGLAAFTFAALIDDSTYTLAALGLSVPVVIALLTRSAYRARDRRQLSR